MHILLTGATGYIGSALLASFGAKHEITTAGRRVPAGSATHHLVTDISRSTDWRPALRNVEVIIHCAGRAHERGGNEEFATNRAVNAEGTLRLARQAADEGVRRLVFVSSIGVNGNVSQQPFSADDPPNPSDAYALSKYEAEQELWSLQSECPMEVVVVRPPLVYGPGAPGNFGRLMNAIRRGVPLPLGAIDNRRSFVALDNLVDIIVRCAEVPAAANQVFLAADGEDLSTTEFLRRLGQALSRPARLLPVPVPALEILGAMTGRREFVRKLCCNLQVDIAKTRQLLDWRPQVSVDEGLKRAALQTRSGV